MTTMATTRRKLIDIGANLTDPMFQGIYNGRQKHPADLKGVLSRAQDVGVDKIIVTAGCLQDVEKAVQLVKSHSFLYTTTGCHPTRCLEFTESSVTENDYMKQLVDFANANLGKIVAVGEIGLDYDRLHFCPKDVQLKYFEKQLEIADKTKLPLFLHCRNAADDLLRILMQNREKFSTGVVHSFDGTLDEAQKFLQLGLFIGINGCSLKTEDNLKVIKELPKEKILIETDAPWCEIKTSHASFPLVKTKFSAKKKEKYEVNFPVKGRNEPMNLVQVLEVLSGVMETDIDDLAECFYKNSIELFFSGNQT